MKPADAAKLFAEMAPDFAAGFLGRMNPGAAASVMGGLVSLATGLNMPRYRDVA